MSETVNKFSFQWKKDSVNCLYLTEINTAKKALNILSSCLTLGIDTETYATTDTEKGALDPHNGSIRLIQIGSTKNVCVFDVVKIQKTTSEDLSLIFKDFLSQNIQFIAHNALFDLKFLTNWISPDKYIIPFNFRCSYILYKLVHHIRSALDTTASNASLANVVKSLLGVNLAKGCQASDWGNEDLTHEQIEYAALDPVVTLQVYEKLYPYIKNYKLNNVYNLMCELQKPIAMAELRGIGFNKDAHKDLYKSWAIKLYEARENLVKLIGQDKVTPHSLAKYLENTLPQDLKERWPKTEKGKFQTDAHALADFDWLPEVKPIGLFAKYNKLVSSYGESFKQHINSKTSRIHCSFNIAGARTGRLSCMSPNMQQCCDPSTEVLTKNGWVRFDRLVQSTDEIAQYNEDGTINFTKFNLIKNKYKGNLIHINSEQIDLMVTPNHRCFTRHRRSLNIEVIDAINLKEDRLHYHAGVHLQGKLSLEENFLKLLVATQADGHLHDGGIAFAFSKKRKYKRLLCILNNLNASYSIHKPGKRNKYKLRIKKSKLVEDVVAFLTENKTFQPWVLQLTQKCLNIFCNEIFYWDGSFTRKSNYSSCQEINADLVQAVFTLNNRRARKRLYNYKQFSTSYQVDIPTNLNRNYSMTTNVKKDIYPYEGYVYCVQVPSTFFIVRRNGKVSITGNCPREFEFRNLFIASEGYTLVVADYSQIEVRVAAEISKDPEMLKVYREGLDIYVYTASKVFHKPMDKVSKHERTLCKSLVLGLLYGLGANGFVHYVKKGSGIDVPLTEAQELVEKFRETYSVYRSWQLKQAENAAESCMTATLLGKKRRLEADNTYGPSMNTPIQGTAGEIMSLALVNMYKKIVQESLKCYIILTVHDEMVLECVEEQADKVCIHLEEAMKEAYLTIFPEGITQGLVEATKGYTWSEAKK